MSAPILIIDDEAAIRRLVRSAIERGGWQAEEAATAAEGLAAARRTGCEVVLLNLGLPDRDGMELVPLIKAADRAVIVLTARDATEEKVAALDLGADDYVTKPFDTEELLARVRVSMRRRVGADAQGVLRVGPLVIDSLRHSVTNDAVEVKLTPKEFALLAELARHSGRVVTHRKLLATIWGEAHVEDVEYLRVTMRALRQKVEADPARPAMLINEPGIGYRLTVG